MGLGDSLFIVLIVLVIPLGSILFLLNETTQLEKRITALERKINKCTHGYKDWSDCPVCGH